MIPKSHYQLGRRGVMGVGEMIHIISIKCLVGGKRETILFQIVNKMTHMIIQRIAVKKELILSKKWISSRERNEFAG